LINLYRESPAAELSLDTAISRALLVRASRGEIDGSLRIYRPSPSVVFGRLDKLSSGFSEAVQDAHRLGFGAVLRLVGGRAAVFDQTTIAFAHVLPDTDPMARTEARFRQTADMFASALRAIGVDARVGEVPGEYCPGAYSVNARGVKKLVGVGQRIITAASHIGGVLVVGGADRIRGVLEPVYKSLDLSWDPSTVGAVENEADVSWDEVEDALIGEWAKRYDLREASIDEITLALAREFEPDHRVRVGLDSIRSN
jgi:octanoyl-[GcvH]:protein N-octanoyltransferase